MDNELIIKAIQKINPNAEVSISGGDINSIVWENNTTPINKSDIETQIPIVEAEEKQAKIDAETKRASAKQKLQDLGLTVDEIKEAFGI